MRGDIEYIADSFLIERVFAGFEKDFVKEAQLASVLSGIGDSIKSFVGSQIHGEDSGGITRTLVNLLAPATFFRLHPLLGMVVTAGQLFGIDIYNVFQRIMGAVSPMLQSGQPVPPDVINDAAKSAIGESTATTASLLAPLSKVAVFGRSRSSSTESPLVRMFSFLGPKRGGNILVGIIAWFVKTVLLSAGMLAVGGTVTKALGFEPGQKAPAHHQSGYTTGTPSFNTGPNQSVMYDYRPNPNDLWIEDLDGQEPHERLLQWVSEGYPDLYQYQDIIVKVPSFWQAVRGISRNWTPGKSQMSIPQPYKTRNDILSLFMNDVFNEIQKGTQ